jgi:hypothetical protein
VSDLDRSYKDGIPQRSHLEAARVSFADVRPLASCFGTPALAVVTVSSSAGCGRSIASARGASTASSISIVQGAVGRADEADPQSPVSLESRSGPETR